MRKAKWFNIEKNPVKWEKKYIIKISNGNGLRYILKEFYDKDNILHRCNYKEICYTNDIMEVIKIEEKHIAYLTEKKAKKLCSKINEKLSEDNYTKLNANVEQIFYEYT